MYVPKIFVWHFDIGTQHLDKICKCFRHCICDPGQIIIAPENN